MAIKRNEVLIHTTIWRNLENIMLSERSQAQKITYCMIPFIWNIQKRQIYETENRDSGCLGLGRMDNGR